MGTTKSDLFTDTENRLASLAKAIGHPARIAILRHLATTKACVCGDLVDVLPLSQSTVSQHLRALKAVGIIQGNIEGTSICYCINPAVWAETQAAFAELFGEFKINCC